MNEVEGLIYLCKQAIMREVPDVTLCLSVDMDQLYMLAKKHMLSAITGISLEKAGIIHPKFHKAIDQNYYKNILFEKERKRIFYELDKKQIWHVALKGEELKKWYPQHVMRECADIDILFDNQQEEDVKDLMLALGYQLESYGCGHHDIYQLRSGVCAEMHLALFGVEYERRLNQYFMNVKDRLVRGEGWEYYFLPEDFYIYFLAHNHDHYANGGVGIRALVDEIVFLNRFEETLNWKYVYEELIKLEIDAFEKKLKTLAKKLFLDDFKIDNLQSDERKMLEYMINSGSHGTVENKVENWIQAGGGGFRGKLAFVRRRVFLPMDVVKHSFPFFYKHKWLLPFLPAYRTIKGITGNKDKLKKEWMTFIK